MDKETLFFSLANWGEFGEIRYRATLTAGEKRRIPMLVPGGRRWVVFKYKFGNIVADTINFRFNNVRNYFEQDILIGTELLNFVVEPLPYIVVSGRNAEIVVENTDIAERDFSIVLDFYIITDELQGRIRELVLGEREDFRKIITQLQYKTPKIKEEGFP